MVLSKRKLINNLFLVGFAFYGMGMYRAYKANLSAGLVICMMPFLLILLIHGIDLIYHRRQRVRFTSTYWLGLLYLISLSGAQWMAFARGFPGFNWMNTTVETLLFLVPFHAGLVVQLRNRDDPEFDFAGFILKSLMLLMVVNLLGYAAGLRNLIHGFEGRMNLPFLRTLYDASHILSVVNLMLLFHFKDLVRKPFAFLGVAALYLVNMAIMVNVNSRLSLLVFLILTLLFVLRIIRTVRFLYTISLFTMPLLMSLALLIYEILTLPIFASIMVRVDKEDVTTFNSRTHIWEAAWNWFLSDRRGFLFGNGYNGQYWLDMMEEIAVMFETSAAYLVHMHSTFLQVVMGQGVAGYVLLCILVWQAYSYFRKRYLMNAIEAPLFGAVVYLMFIWQIDIFMYGMDIGHLLFFLILSYISIERPAAPALGKA